MAGPRRRDGFGRQGCPPVRFHRGLPAAASLPLRADLRTGSLIQRAAHEVCRTGFLEEHVERVKPAYRERRDAMLGALPGVPPANSSWSRPEGGLFLWATLPEGIDTGALLAAAVQEGVAYYVPGVAFHAHGDRTNALRLNFSSLPPAQIEEGIRRLGRALARHLALAAENSPVLDLPPDLAPEAA